MTDGVEPEPRGCRLPRADAAADDAPGEDVLHALVAAIVRGDHSAFTDLYHATAGRVYGLALRITRQPAMAEEVTIETYAQLWRTADKYDAARSRVQVWLLTICRSRALDALSAVRPAETLDDHDPPDAGPGPLDLLQQVENHSCIHRALQRLDVRQRQLLALAFFRGMSHSELADFTGMPLGTVKTLLRQGIEELRALLDRPGADLP